MNDKDFEYIRSVYREFEGLTGSQQADGILVLALVMKEALEPIQEELNEIKNAWVGMQKDMHKELNEAPGGE